MRNISPIVLFVYNRPRHTRETIKALQKNTLARKSKLFIYSDAPKNKEAEEKVKEVREYIKTVDGFKKVTIIKKEKNWGLADSIIDGVTKIVNEYGKIIVLEDDLVTSSGFLKFMNDALRFYEDEKKVWHISEWNYPIKTDSLEDVFLWRTMNCWGWATWKDRWQHYEKDVDKNIKEFSKDDIKRFNLDGAEDFWIQIILNKIGLINTWAIFWYVAIFKNKGLCLNPTETFVENTGLDGSGEHCKKENNEYKNSFNNKKNPLYSRENIKFTKNIQENKIAVKRIKKIYQNQKKPVLYKSRNGILVFIVKTNTISLFNYLLKVFKIRV